MSVGHSPMVNVLRTPFLEGVKNPATWLFPPQQPTIATATQLGWGLLSPPSIHAGMLVALATLAAVVLQCPEDTQFTAFLYGLSFLKWILQFLSQVPQSASLHWDLEHASKKSLVCPRHPSATLITPRFSIIAQPCVLFLSFHWAQALPGAAYLG